MMPCTYCADGSNAEFDGWEIVVEGTIEVLCMRFVCKHCGTPTWRLVATREADDNPEDDNPLLDYWSHGGDVS